MPIRREHRGFYLIDWPQLSAVIRFRRAGGRCEGCGRPHLQRVVCLSDGRWWEAEARAFSDEVDTGSSQKTLKNQRPRVVPDCNVIGCCPRPPSACG